MASTPNPLKDNSAKISALVRAGLLKSSELPQLKVALIRQQKVGDVARLSKAHRDVIAKYNSGLSSAALGSQQAFQAVRRNLMNSVEILDKEQLSESINESIDPPMMLVLKRKGVRIFPDGQRVALYVHEKLGITFSVPYKQGQLPEIVPNVTAEEVDHEDMMESIEQVSAYASQENPKASAKHMKFADGSKLKVSHGAAKAIHMVHGALNDENKKKFADMLTSPKGFEKAAHFALSRVKFTIGDE
jgi:hypothetical protein